MIEKVSESRYCPLTEEDQDIRGALQMHRDSWGNFSFYRSGLTNWAADADYAIMLSRVAEKSAP